MAHHGMITSDGRDRFCHYGYQQQDEDRFGRLLEELQPLYVPPQELEDLGAAGGPMDGGVKTDRTEGVPVGQIFFGQFVDHDITLDVTSSFDSVADPSRTPNARTPTLDLDNVYGMGPEASRFLYQQEDGPLQGVRLLTDDDGTAAPGQSKELAKYDLWRSPDGTAVIGDHRNDENRILSQLQLAMIRFHNAVAEDLHEEEGLRHEELFEETQKTVRYHYQYIVVEDYLPAICGQAVVDRIKREGRQIFCPRFETPYIPVEFAVAAYRFGHSMIPHAVQVQQGDDAFRLYGDIFGSGFDPLSSKRAVVDWHELTDTEEDRAVQLAEKLDTKMASALLDLPFTGSGVSSLATRNLLRGQSFLLPAGEEVAERLGRPADEIENVREKAVETARPDADLSSGVPLWFYLLAEAEHKGRETSPGDFEDEEGLGPVGAQIVAETLYGLIELDGRSLLATDRNWHPGRDRDGVGPQTLGEMLTYPERFDVLDDLD